MQYDLKIKKIEVQTHNVKTLYLDLEGQEFNYMPGQFVTFFLKNAEKSHPRSYSISSSPTETEKTGMIGFTVKEYLDSFAGDHLHNKVNIGDSIKIGRPVGKFVFNPEEKNIVMIAGGNGITPLRSIIKYVCDKKLDNNIELIYSNRTEKDIIFYEEFRDLATKHINFKPLFIQTRENPTDKSGLRKRINKEFIEREIVDYKSKVFMVSGSVEMVQDIFKQLIELGIADSQIRTEKFTRPGHK